jgi:hypothetical protein
LSKDRKDLHFRDYLSTKVNAKNLKEIVKNDVIKEKIKKLDQEVDRALF